MRSLPLPLPIVFVGILYYANTRAEKIIYELEVIRTECTPAIPTSTSPVLVNFKGEDTTTSGSYKTTGYMPLTKIHEGPSEKTYVLQAEDVGALTLMQVKLTDDGQLGNWCLGSPKLTVAAHGMTYYFNGGTVQPKLVTDLAIVITKAYTGSPPPFIPPSLSPPPGPSAGPISVGLTPPRPPVQTSPSAGPQAEPLNPVVYILIVGAILIGVFGMITLGCVLADRRSRRKGKDHGKGKELGTTNTGTPSTTDTSSTSSLHGKPVGQRAQPVLGAVKYESISSKTAKLTLDESLKKNARPHVRLDLKKLHSKKTLPQKKVSKIKKKVHHPYQGKTNVFVRKEHKTGHKMQEITDESMKSMRER